MQTALIHLRHLHGSQENVCGKRDANVFARE